MLQTILLVISVFALGYGIPKSLRIRKLAEEKNLVEYEKTLRAGYLCYLISSSACLVSGLLFPNIFTAAIGALGVIVCYMGLTKMKDK